MFDFTFGRGKINYNSRIDFDTFDCSKVELIFASKIDSNMMLEFGAFTSTFDFWPRIYCSIHFIYLFFYQAT
jgi:hypothetical protein